MPTHKRQDIQAVWQAIAQGSVAPVYLLFGERYLCRQVADELTRRLLPDQAERDRNLHAIDGDQEDPLATLNRLRTFSLLPGRQLFRVTDSRLFFSKGVAKTLWDKAQKAYDKKDFKEAGRLAGQFLDLGGLTGDNGGEEVAGLAAGRWRTLFGFAKPQGKMDWLTEVLTASPPMPAAKPAKAGDTADLYVEALEGGIPAGNILILLAEAADKRKRLYKYLETNATVIDLSVDTGASSAARKDQEGILMDLAQKTLADFGKKIAPRALTMLLDRVGFHPVAMVMETEKLALSVGDAATISVADLEAVIGHTREEALFAFTEAVASRKLGEALTIMARLRESQMHPLVLVSGLRNHLRKLLFIRALQEQAPPTYQPGIQYGAFQKGYLAQLKASRPEWPEQLAGHPFVVYKLFQQAEHFSLADLKTGLTELLEAEYRLKGAGLPENAVLENMLFRLLNAHQPKSAAMGGS